MWFSDGYLVCDLIACDYKGVTGSKSNLPYHPDHLIGESIMWGFNSLYTSIYVEDLRECLIPFIMELIGLVGDNLHKNGNLIQLGRSMFEF